MSDSIELQHKLQEARNEQSPSSYTNKQVRTTRTAKLDDAAKLLESGLFTPEQIAYSQNLSLRSVLAERARLDRENERRQRFLRTAQMESEEGGYLAIFK